MKSKEELAHDFVLDYFEKKIVPALKKELDEQLRVNGMGAQRELALQTKLNIAIEALKHGKITLSCNNCDSNYRYQKNALSKINGGSGV